MEREREEGGGGGEVPGVGRCGSVIVWLWEDAAIGGGAGAWGGVVVVEEGGLRRAPVGDRVGVSG